jgi:Mlc titration factor MtfA (ptsG expression regulator)
METPQNTFIFIVAAVSGILCMGAVLFYFFKLLQLATSPLRKLIFYTLFPDSHPVVFDQYLPVLSERFSYFLMLNEKEQKLFVSRLHYIRQEKSFVGRGLEITEEMEIMVSAALSQLTFGLVQFDLENLDEIHLTPESFYSRLAGADVKGLTFESGRMILSWADFKQGYLINDDKINLGLHELAHALWLYHAPTASIEEHFDQWHMDALSELRKKRNGETTGYFLRDYAFTNIEEFWACSVECFFEAPIEFKKSVPNLYQKTSAILNQDMATRFEIYSSCQSTN